MVLPHVGSEADQCDQNLSRGGGPTLYDWQNCTSYIAFSTAVEEKRLQSFGPTVPIRARLDVWRRQSEEEGQPLLPLSQQEQREEL